MQRTTFIFFCFVAFIAADPVVCVAQSVTVDLTRIIDGRFIGTEHRSPYTAWRQPDGGYLYFSRGGGMDGRSQSPLLQVNPNTNDVRFVRLFEPSPQGLGLGTRERFGAFRNNAYCSVAPTGSDFFGPTGGALRIVDMTTLQERTIIPPGSDQLSDPCLFIDASTDLVLLTSPLGWWVVDSDLTWTRITKQGLPITGVTPPAFFVYSRGTHHLIYSGHKRWWHTSDDGGRSWEIDSTLFGRRVKDAAIDEATGLWYCLADSGVYTVDSSFAFTLVNVNLDISQYTHIQVNNGTIVLRDDNYEDGYRHAILWRNGEVTTTGRQSSWADVSFSDDGNRVVYGHLKQLIGISVSGQRDTVSLDLSTSLEQICRIGDGSWLSGSSMNGRLRRSFDRMNWQPVWDNRIDGVRDIAADGEFVVIVDSARGVYVSDDTSATFIYVSISKDTAEQIAHISHNMFALRNRHSVDRINAALRVYTHIDIDDTAATLDMTTSRKGDVAALMSSGSIYEIGDSDVIPIPLTGILHRIFSIEYDRDGTLWAGTSGGPYRFDTSDRRWIAARINAPMSSPVHLACTSGEELLAFTGEQGYQSLTMWNTESERWMTISDSTSRTFNNCRVLDYDKDALYINDGFVFAIERRQVDETFGWVGVGNLEEFVGVQTRDSYSMIPRYLHGPVAITDRGAHTFTTDLRDISDQWPISVSRLSDHTFVDNDRSIIAVRHRDTASSLVLYEVEEEQLIDIEQPPASVVGNMLRFCIMNSDTLFVTSTGEPLSDTVTYTLWRGLQSTSDLCSLDVPKGSPVAIFSRGPGSAGFVTSRAAADDQWIVSTVFESGDVTTLQFHAHYGARTLAVAASHLAIMYQPMNSDPELIVEVYDLLQGARIAQRSVARSTMTSGSAIDFIADGRLLLVQVDSLWLLDPLSLETKASTDSRRGKIYSPIAYQDWIIGTSILGRPVRWRPAGVVLSVSDDHRKEVTDTWHVHVDQTHLSILDLHRGPSVQYHLVMLDGSIVRDTEAEHININGLASGIYYVTRVDRENGAFSAKPVLVLR